MGLFISLMGIATVKKLYLSSHLFAIVGKHTAVSSCGFSNHSWWDYCNNFYSQSRSAFACLTSSYVFKCDASYMMTWAMFMFSLSCRNFKILNHCLILPAVGRNAQHFISSMICAGFTVGVVALVKANGKQFCSRPRLCGLIWYLVFFPPLSHHPLC